MKAREYAATVVRREQLSPHLVRLVLGGLEADAFASSGVPDEWVGLVVPGQFQSRYYTVRSWDGAELVLDVVVHDEGLVTEWASRDCVGELVTHPGAEGLVRDAGVGRVAAARRRPDRDAGDGADPGDGGLDELDQRVAVWAEVPDDLAGYLPDGADVTWLAPPGRDESALASVVEGIDWPEGEGYFWMAGESAQMRAIRKHLMREVRLPSTAYDVMGYWRGGGRRQPRAVDPGPIWRAGKAAGKSDEEIWAAYDAEVAR